MGPLPHASSVKRHRQRKGAEHTSEGPKDPRSSPSPCGAVWMGWGSRCRSPRRFGHSSNGSFSRLRHGFGMARRQAVGAGTVGAAVFGGAGTDELGAGIALGISALVAEGAADATGAVEAVGSARVLADAAPLGGPTLRHAWGAAVSASLEQLVTAIPASAVAMKNARLRRISLRASSSEFIQEIVPGTRPHCTARYSHRAPPHHLRLFPRAGNC